MENNHCSHCKSQENLIKYARTKYRQYYYCTPCNTERQKTWRKKEGNMAKQVGYNRKYRHNKKKCLNEKK